MKISSLKGALNVPFVRNLATFQAGSVVMMATGLLTSVIYARMLGVAQFGMYAVISSFAGILSIGASFGQETTLVTFLSEAVGKKSEKDIEAVLRYFLQSTLIASAIYAVLWIIAPWAAAATQSSASVGLLARYVILTMALQSPPVLVFLMLQIRGKVLAVSLLENMRALLQAAISITLLFMGYGVEGILIGTLSVAVLYVPVCAYIYRVIARELRFPHMKKLLFSVRKRDTGTYFKQGLWIAADRQISRNLYPNIFLLILNATTSLETVGLFRLALRLGSLPAEMITPNITRLSAVAIPKVAAENVIRLKEASLKLMKGTMGLIGLAVLVCAFVVPPLIPVVYGTAFTAAALPFLVILPFNIISAFSVATVPVARVFKKVWMLTVSNASGIIVGSAAFFILRDAITPLVAMGAAILAYHLNSVVLAVILWRFILRQHTELRSVRG